MNKKHFINLGDSIMTALLTLAELSMFILMLYWGVLHAREGTNPTAALIVAIIIFALPFVFCLCILYFLCFQYWIITDTKIIYKKMLRKKTVIDFCRIDRIDRIEKKVVDLYSCGINKREAFVVYSGKDSITILNDKNAQKCHVEEMLQRFKNIEAKVDEAKKTNET